jgi:hypothetical protein
MSALPPATLIAFFGKDRARQKYEPCDGGDHINPRWRENPHTRYRAFACMAAIPINPLGFAARNL